MVIKGSRECIAREETLNSNIPVGVMDLEVRNGLPCYTLMFLKLCAILEPMQELMSRHKPFYSQQPYDCPVQPRDCLVHVLMQKHQRSQPPISQPPAMMLPPEVAVTETATRPTRRRKRKGSNSGQGTPNSGGGGKKKNANSPAPIGPPGFNTSMAHVDVMMVGEPSLMGGDFGEEDERLISRLENTQFDPSNMPASRMPLKMEPRDSLGCHFDGGPPNGGLGLPPPGVPSWVQHGLPNGFPPGGHPPGMGPPMRGHPLPPVTSGTPPGPPPPVSNGGHPLPRAGTPGGMVKMGLGPGPPLGPGQMSLDGKIKLEQSGGAGRSTPNGNGVGPPPGAGLFPGSRGTTSSPSLATSLANSAAAAASGVNNPQTINKSATSSPLCNTPKSFDPGTNPNGPGGTNTPGDHSPLINLPMVSTPQPALSTFNTG